MVSGAAHGVVFANTAFRALSARAGARSPDTGVPVIETLPLAACEGLPAILNRVRRDGMAVHNGRLGNAPRRRTRPPAKTWCCDVWPVTEGADRLDYLMVTFRSTRRAEDQRAHQRAITERLLLTALRELERARQADHAGGRAAFLAGASLRLTASFEQEAAYAAVATVALPTPGSWSIVDVVQPDGAWRRLAIAHPDQTKHSLIRELDGHWSPAPGDPLGAPLIALSRQATIVHSDTETVLAVAAHGADNLRILRAIDLGALLVVPLIAHDRLRGAITFVGPSGGVRFTPDDVMLAEDLAIRCAGVLDGARLYDDARRAHVDADVARVDAERSNELKTSFLTSMSHELRTPLNAMLGYTELLSMGLRGPVSTGQLDALGRIRRAGTHLLGVISEVLNVAKLRSTPYQFELVDVPVDAVLESATVMIEAQATTKGVTLARTPNSPTLAMHGDRDKVLQILLNLLSNAVKFTEAGGRITLAASPFDRRWRAATASPTQRPATGRRVQFTVTDTGRGIPAEKLRMIFEPFVQVGQRLGGSDEGTGLGLTISRDLARAMGGELTAESTIGVGSAFTLTMPCAAP